MLSRQARGLTALVIAVLGVLPIVARPIVPVSWALRLILDSFVPWTGIAIGVAIIMGVSTRALPVIGITLVPAIVWAAVFVPRILPLDPAPGSSSDLTIVTQNIGGDVASIHGMLAEITAQNPQVIALEEVTAESASQITETLADDGYSNVRLAGTVGVWSSLPLARSTALDLGLGWDRAIRVDVESKSGVVRLYIVHAASARFGANTERNSMIGTLTDLVAADASERLIVAGDFNATTDDHVMAGLMGIVSEPRLSSGGFGFTWPSGFPATSPDHILLRGLPPTQHVVLGATGSDHRGVAVSVSVADAVG